MNMGERRLSQAELEEAFAFCLEHRICFKVPQAEEIERLKRTALKLGFKPYRVDQLAKGQEAFFIGPFGAIIFGRIVERIGPIAVWKGLDSNKTSRHCTITSAVYRRTPRDLIDRYLVWARLVKNDQTSRED